MPKAARHQQSDFIPALKYDVLTPLYDVAIRVTLPERRFKNRLLDAARIVAGHRVLDVGCGSGTLLRMAARQSPEAIYFGVDPDARIRAYAARKLRGIRPAVTLEAGLATQLPYEDASFDRVLSSLVVHHLAASAKPQAFIEIHRVLRPGGEFHLADFGAPDTRLMRSASFLAETIGHEHVEENFAGLLPSMIKAAGFHQVEETGRFATIFGVIRLIRAVKMPA